MIDDERLQELLAKASSLYNNGEYQGAIEAWKEAIGVDPGSQKAREGIRMATLLLGDNDAAPAASQETPAVPADGADPAGGDAPAEETEARIDLGIARVKQLLSERKYAEAIEGAQGLLPLAPDSPAILRLLEEAQHAFESTPFIEEHLTLSRELLGQERFSEAEAECKKVFTLDATHPGGKTLLKEIRDKIQASLKAAASQLGGMTVKLTMPQAIAAGVRLKSPAAAPEPPAPPASRTAPDPLPEMYEEPAKAPAGEPEIPASGEGALAQEDVAARAALEAAFDSSLGGAPEESPFELAEGAGAVGTPAPPAEEVVEARTVRPPTSRVVPPQPAAAAPVAQPAKPAAAPAQAHTPAAGPVVPPPVLGQQAKKAQEPPVAPAAGVKPPSAGAKTPAATTAAAAKTPAAPQPAAAKGTPHAAAPAAKTGAQPKTPAAPAGAVPVADVPEDATAAWETELTQLNLKDKERGLLRGTGAKASGKPVDTGEMDLMSLLDTGGMPGMPGGDAAVPQPASVPLAKAKETPAKSTPHPAPAPVRPHAVEGAAAARHESPVTATKLRSPERPRPMPAASRGGSSFMTYLLLFLLLLAGGGGALYYYRPELAAQLLSRYLPRLLGGAGQPSHPVAPPAGAPAGTVDLGHAPIPTPIGGTSKQQATAPEGDGASVPAQVAGAAPNTAPGRAVPSGTSQGGQAAPGAAPAGAPAPAPAGTPAQPRPVSNEPIKPPTVPPLSREERQRKIAAYTADGRRLIALGKWREARAKLNAVLALDPANIEVKDLADKAQAKIDDDQMLQDEFDSTKRCFAEKDYENALRKLYRLPRDKGLGDIDLYIRNSWYNWAVVLMKAGNTKDALVKLNEELTLDPDDSAALKLQEVGEKYMNRAKDRTYYAFTDALTLRVFDQR